MLFTTLMIFAIANVQKDTTTLTSVSIQKLFARNVSPGVLIAMMVSVVCNVKMSFTI